MILIHKRMNMDQENRFFFSTLSAFRKIAIDICVWFFFLISENIFTKHIYLLFRKYLKKWNFPEEFYFKFS